MEKETDDHLQSIKECPDCASENIVHSTMRDQVICKDCGLVFEPFTPLEKPGVVKSGAEPARKAKKKATRKAKPKKAKARKAKTSPARKQKKKARPAKKKWGWW